MRNAPRNVRWPAFIRGGPYGPPSRSGGRAWPPAPAPHEAALRGGPASKPLGPAKPDLAFAGSRLRVASGAALAAALLLAGCQEKVGSSRATNGSRPASAPGRRSRPSAQRAAAPRNVRWPAFIRGGPYGPPSRSGGRAWPPAPPLPLGPAKPDLAFAGSRLRIASGAALAAALLLAGCQEKVGSSSPYNVPWSTDMYMQPSVYPQELPYQPVPGTVPVGAEPAELPHMVASERLKNPVPFTEVSVNRGRVPYTNFCVPCHGVEGKGDGPVAAKFIPPPPLDGPAVKGRTDGFIYATIRLGSLSTLMPAYGARMTEQERWDLVNYVRSLQGAKPQPGPAAPVQKTMLAPAPETATR